MALILLNIQDLSYSIFMVFKVVMLRVNIVVDVVGSNQSISCCSWFELTSLVINLLINLVVQC